MIMTPEEYIEAHTVAVDYNNGETVQMIPRSLAREACRLAEKHLAKTLLELHESARAELLERIINQ